MKTFLGRVLAACAVFAMGATMTFAVEGWGDNYQKALVQAKEQKKLVVLDFTGSDWCGWCIKLNREVFSKPEFKEYARNNLVLVEVDFPQLKTQPKELKQQNEKLQQRYNVEVFPTIIVLNPKGKVVGKLGYQAGGPKPFIAALDALKGK